jgi:hypothetical protein
MDFHENYQHWWDKVEKMSDDDLNTIWKCLVDYDPSEEYNGMSADSWAEIIYIQMTRRGLKTT